MHTTRLLLSIAAALLLIGSRSALAQESVIVGIAVPLSGPFAPLGQAIEAGVRTAISNLSGGGADGMMLDVVVIDDGCDAERAQAVANQLAGAGAVMVVGHLCSAAAIAAAPVYAAERIIQIAPGAPDPAYTEDRAGIGTFRLYPRSDAQARTIVDFLATTYSTMTIAIIDDRTSYGRRLAAEVRAGLAAQGLTALVNESYFRSEFDPVTLAGRLAAAGVGVAFAAGEPAEMAALRSDLLTAGLEVPFVTGDVAADPAFMAEAGANAEGTIFAFPTDFAAAPDAAGAVAALEAAGVAPDNAALYGYAAVEIWLSAVGAANGTDFEDVAAAIEGGVFKSALGTIDFNGIGEADVSGWIIQTWEDGAHVPYRP